MSMVDMASGLEYNKEAFIGQGLIGRGLIRAGKILKNSNLKQKGVAYMRNRVKEEATASKLRYARANRGIANRYGVQLRPSVSSLYMAR